MGTRAIFAVFTTPSLGLAQTQPTVTISLYTGQSSDLWTMARTTTSRLVVWGDRLCFSVDTMNPAPALLHLTESPFFIYSLNWSGSIYPQTFSSGEWKQKSKEGGGLGSSTFPCSVDSDGPLATFLWLGQNISRHGTGSLQRGRVNLAHQSISLQKTSSQIH